MTGQLALAVDVGDDLVIIARIVDQVLAEVHDLTQRPPAEDEANAQARARLLAGDQLLLDWLDGRRNLPRSWQPWPCSACMAEPFEPCVLPNRHRRDKWITASPAEQHHLSRGLDGRWAHTVRSHP